MKKHQIDNLFRDKLEDYRPTPSRDIWLELQGNLESKKNNKKWLYLRIAAGLSLVALITYALIFTANNDIRNETNTNNLSVQNEANNAIQKSNEESNELAESENIVKKGLISNLEKDQNLTNQQNTPDHIKQSDIATEMIKGRGLELAMDQDLYFSEIVINKAEVPVIDIEQEATLLSANDEIDDKKQSVTITYVIGDLNPEIIEEEDPKQSKLKKAWEFAKNVKNGEEKLPNLRELKNELLAFNKKKTKTQDNNN